MKLGHRVLSLLLAMSLFFGLLSGIRPTVAEAAVADTPAGVRNHLPSTAKDVVYLSDMTWEYSLNYQDKEAIKNGAWSNGGAIVMGASTANGGTTFTKGLGVMAKGTSATDASHTIFDLADNNYAQNYFYAAAGITNATALGGTITNGLVFEVWGSYDKSQDDYTKAEYTLLERSGNPDENTHVTKGYVYQFHLDVTDVRYLKLVVYAVGSIGYMNANWAGVCVYNNPGYYPKSHLMGLNNKTDNTTWVPSGTDRFNTYHFESIPDDAILLSGSTFKDASTYKGTAKMVDFKSASGHLGSGAHWLGGVADRLDTAVTPNLKDGLVLKDATKYLRFNARTPANSGNQTDGWVTFDISGLNVNRFYTVIGGGNGTAKHTAYTPSNGTYGGVVCQVWGAETKDGEYKLLSESEPILLSQTGEFLVDITGVNFLKLRIQAKDYRIINGLDTLFYMPCLFNEWDIAVSGAASVVQGTQENYTTTIRHDFTENYNYPGTINWEVSGGAKSGTKIVNGKLSVDPAETATSLQVTASITEGSKTATSEPITVAVTKAPVYTLEIQGPAEASKNTEHNIITTVKKDDVPETYDKIQWSVSGNTDPATKVENGKLTIGNETVGTELTVKASLTEYGVTLTDTVKVKITAYGVSIQGNTAMFPGTQTTLQAAVANQGQPVNATVTWSVEGNGTIVANGNQVVVTAKGTVGTVKVTATWNSPAGDPYTAVHEIAVNAYTLDVTSAATAVSQGGTLPLSAVVKKNGENVANATVTWTIVNLKSGDVSTKTGTSFNLAANADVDSVLVITAVSEFGGLTVSDSCVIKVTDYKLVIDPAASTVEQGSTTELKATLNKGTTPVTNPVITWSVTKADGSAVNVSGDTLNLLADQPVGTELTVVASSVVDGETILSAPAKVTVVAPVVYNVTLNKTTASVKQGESTTFTASVTKDGSAVSNPTLSWSVTGGTKPGTTIDDSGKLTVDSNEPADTKLYVTATATVGGKQVTSDEAVVTVTSAAKQDAFSVVTNGYQSLPSNAIYLADDGVNWIESVNLGGAPAIRNGQWSNGATIWIGGGATTGGTNFQKGIGVQPQSPTATNNRGASWTTIDISGYNCDTFYAAVGSTNAANQQNGHNSFIYQVFGATEQNGTYTLLAESTPLTRTTTGEFKVDISGVKYLKLLIKCTDTGGHGYGNSVWANAAIYNTTVDSYGIKVVAPAANVQQGKDITLTAEINKNGQPLTGQTVTWAVSGATKSGTKIDANGKLTVDAKEPAGTKLIVGASITVAGTTYTSTAVTITVDEAPSEYYQADAFKENTTGKYATLASNVTYLSDIPWVESVNNENKESIRNGAWSNGAAIWIGGGATSGGTNFQKGIGVQPQSPTATNNRGASWTTIDVSSYNCDTFYAAVGSTNAANQQNGHNSFIYQVYGATEKDGAFVLLAESAPLTKTQTGEFSVNIKDMKLLKLVIKCTETGNHGYGNSVWANAAIYDSTADSYIIEVTAPATTVQQGKDITFTAAITKNGKPLTGQTITWAVTGATVTGTAIDATGKLTADKKEPIGTKLSVTASITVDKITYTSVPTEVTVEEARSELYQADAFKENTTGKYAQLAKNVIYLSDVKWIESVNNENKEAIRNGVWSNGGAIYIGGESNSDVKDGTKFEKGIGVQPMKPTATNNRGASWTTIHAADLKCDTFYAAVGSTNAANQEFGHNSFIYQVFGNTEKDGEFQLLAESKPLTKTETGEFTVSIKGIYDLKLVIKCAETGNHGYGNSVWANACVYNQDGSDGNLSAMTEGKTSSSETPKQPKAFTMTDGTYLAPVGKVTFISDMEWVESVNLGGVEAIRNGAWSNGAAIWLGGASEEKGGTKFVKGIGVQPQAPTADNNRGASWTTVDITDMNVDVFYAVVGGTNVANQEIGHNSFIYQVYGAEKEDGKYTLLAQSEPITKTQTGEFQVDVTDVNFLKLQIKCTDTGNHGYGNSAWANACVFNSADARLVEGGEYEPIGPTTPTTTLPRPTAPVEETDDGAVDGVFVAVLAAAVAVVAGTAAGAILIIKKKRRK